MAEADSYYRDNEKTYVINKENRERGYHLFDVEFKKDSFVIMEVSDWYANNEDDLDSEWEESFTVMESNYEKVIENIQNQFTPYPLTSFDNDMTEIYNLIENDKLKLIFQYIISIKMQFNNGRLLGAERLINILCGKDIEYKYYQYSKGP